MNRRFRPAAILLALSFLAFFLCPVLRAATELGRPIMRVFTPRVYGADAQNFCAVQDASGILYFGNSNGVLTYDGARWSVVKTGYSENIRGLALANDGNIYVGGVNQIGYVHTTATGRAYVSLIEQLPKDGGDYAGFFRVVAHRDAVYFTTPHMILAWRDGRFTRTAIENPTTTPVELHVVGDELIVTVPNQPLRRLRDDRLEVVSDDPFFRDKDISFVEREADGGLFFATSKHGLFRWRDGKATAVTTEADTVLKTTGLYRARRLRDGSLALMLNSQTGTLFVDASGRFLWRIDDSAGLPSRVVIDVVGDREGGVWLCLSTGLARLEWPSAFTMFEHGFHGVALARQDGVFYAGTDESLFRLIPGTVETGNARLEEVTKGRALALLPDRDGLLIAEAAGIFRVDLPGVVKVLTVGKTVYAMLRSERDPDRVWLASAEEISSMHRAGREWRHEDRIENLPTGARTLAEIDGALWFATLKDGVYRVRFGAPSASSLRGTAEVTHFEPGTHGLSPKHNTMRAYRWGDRLVLAQGAEGLWQFDPKTEMFSRLPQTESQVADPRKLALFLNASAPDHLWVQRDTNDPRELAVFRVPAEGAVQTLPHAPIDAAHFARVLFEEAGPEGPVLWVGGNDGLLRVDTKRAFASPPPVLTLIQSPAVRDGQQLEPNPRLLEFEVVAPVFRPGGAPEYQTRLVGFDHDWSPWSEERKRVFTNLHPGSYRFETRARDNDGQVSAIASRSFSVRPPWWRTWWMIGLMSVSGVGGVAGVTRWFANRALKRRVALLEAQSAVERERLRLARDLHDEVGSGLGRVILFAGEARRNKSDPAQLDASLERVRDAAQGLVQHAREIVWAVSPQHDTLQSVIERFGDYVDETLRAAGIACRIESPSADQIPPITLGSEARHSLFLAVKEAVHNCVKYSEAKTAEFRLEIAGNDFVITLRDHGRGFTPGERRGSGHGAGNLAARAAALDGTAEVTTAPGQGTTVRLSVPLAKS